MIVAAWACASAQPQTGHLHDFLREKLRWTPEEAQRRFAEMKAGHIEAPHGAREPAGGAAGRASATTREVVVSDDPEVESEVQAAINPTDSNNIIVSPIGAGSGTLSLLCPIYYTKDFGVTWQKSAFQTAPRGTNMLIIGGGDPVVAFDADGTAYLAWISVYYKDFSTTTLHVGIYYATSTDGGATWSRPEHDTICYAKIASSSPTGEFFDKEWFGIDRSSTPTRNTVYLAFVHETPDGDSRISVSRLAPGGTGFTQTAVPVHDDRFDFVQFANADVDDDGRLHVTFFGVLDVDTNFAVWHVSSTDAGRTFSEPVKISNVRHPRFNQEDEFFSVAGIDDQRLYTCPELAVDKTAGPTRGNVYMTWTADGMDTRLDNGLDIYFSRSTDHGESWSAPVVVNSDPRGVDRHQYYSSICVNPNGVVAVTWYDRRTDPENRATHYYIAYSFDGGRTFTHGTPVSSQPTDFASVGEQNGGFGIGEYTQVLATGGYAIPVWTDGRSNTGDLNIYAAFVPVSAEASGVERVTDVKGGVALAEPVIAGNDVTIAFHLSEASAMRLDLYDAVGRRVATVAEGRYAAGDHVAHLDATAIPAGRYFLHLRGTNGDATRAMVRGGS